MNDALRCVDESEVPNVIRLKYLLGAGLKHKHVSRFDQKDFLMDEVLGHEGFILKSAGDRVKEMLLLIYTVEVQENTCTLPNKKLQCH